MPFIQDLPFAPGSHTSAKAAARHASSSGRATKLARLTAAYQVAGARGMTDAEARRVLDVPVQSICSLRAALMQRGLVGRGGERMGEYGLKVSVWLWIDGAAVEAK